MRNLTIVRKVVTTPPYNDPSNFCAADLSSCLAIDSVKDGSAGHRRLVRINVQQPQQKSVDEIHVFSEQELELLHPLDKAVQTYYAPVLDTFLIATCAGGFYQFNVTSKALDEIFLAPSGISHFEMSPDSRILAVATNEETVILFSVPDFDLLNTIELGPMRPEGSDDETYRATVRWRWDSRYFAVNFFNGVVRKIRTYDDTGKLYAESEESVVVTSECLAWQPSGGLIGTLGQTRSGNTVVMFLELNGLKRSEFDPDEGRSKGEPVLDLLWNSSSDILALKKKSCVELWHRSNYFWMLKKTVNFEAVSEAVDQGSGGSCVFLSWDLEINYRLHVVTSDGSYGLYEFLFDYSKGRSDGSALVASINGNSVYTTPFRDTCAPPPQCMYQLKTEDSIQEVVVTKFFDGLLCVHNKGNLSFFKNTRTALETLATLSVENGDRKFQTCYNWVWPNKSELVCISDGDLLVFDISSAKVLEECSKEMQNMPVALASSLKVRGKLITPIFKDKETKHLLVQKRCGAILLQELCVMPNILLGRLPNTVHQLKCFVNSDEISENSVIVFGLDPLTRQLHMLYRNKTTKIMNDCTSFDIFEDWLLVTTLQGSLEVFRMTDLFPASIADDLSLPENLVKYSRKVEKGSVIVTSCWNRILEPTVTLQILPRGNLETISPRPLIISSIAVLLKDRKYNEVMLAMRRHRLDFNVLATQIKNLANEEATAQISAKELLIMHLTSLMEDVKDSHTVVLMVTELGPEHGDCVEYMKQILEAKVIAGSAEETSNSKLVNPYLAVMAKLQLFEEVLLSPLISLNNSNRELVKSRIKFLGFYCENPDILYDSALGSYDLTLTSLVADCLNKDPKEYLPTLNDYQKLPEAKLKYTIDHKLRRYSRAAVSLIELGDTPIEEVISYTERYKIHEAVIKYLEDRLKSISSNEDRLKYERILEHVYRSYAKVHTDQQNFSEAAICFYRGKDYTSTCDNYGKAGQWAAAVKVAQSAGLEGYEELLRKLVKYSEERKDYDSAAQILEYYLKSPEDAFRSYIKGRNWNQALRLVNSSTLQAEFKSELESAASSLQDSCIAAREDISRYRNRLRIVKELKEKALAAEGNFGDGDNFSDTESVSTTASVRSSGASSAFTGKTFRSGKNTRKLKRKVYSLKEGSRFEDLAIIAHLWETIQKVQNDIKPQVEALAPILWHEELDSIAISVISTFEQLLGQTDECVKEVWPTVLPYNELLEAKFCVSPPGWSATWKKCSLVSRAVLHRK